MARLRTTGRANRIRAGARSSEQCPAQRHQAVQPACQTGRTGDCHGLRNRTSGQRSGRLGVWGRFFGRHIAIYGSREIDGERGDATLDVFSLGITLYELITQTTPFDAINRSSLLTAFSARELKPPISIVHRSFPLKQSRAQARSRGIPQTATGSLHNDLAKALRFSQQPAFARAKGILPTSRFVVQGRPQKMTCPAKQAT